MANGHTPGKCRGTCKVGDTVVEQELIYEKLPGDIAQRHVLLMDPILATGNSAARAIQVRSRQPAAWEEQCHIEMLFALYCGSSKAAGCMLLESEPADQYWDASAMAVCFGAVGLEALTHC